MHTHSRSGLIASIIGTGLALAVAFAPATPAVADVSANGAVKPMTAPGAFLNAPTTTNQYGGQESLTFDPQGHLLAVGRTPITPSTGSVHLETRMRARTAATTRNAAYGTTRSGVWVAPRVTLPTQP